MQADEVHHEDSAGESRARSGPRHAAPRKPLLTRLQMPAGKAIALAAMPSAVLMGMGLTPTLAQAKPGIPKNPFQDGPCVTAPDDASKDVEKEAKDAKDAKDAEDAKKKAEQDEAGQGKTGKGETGKDSTGPTPPASGTEAGSEAGSGAGSGDKAGSDEAGSDKAGTGDKDTDEKPEPDPAPSETKNPWDPLGVGDALKDVFTPDDKESPSPTPTPSASDETKSPEDRAKDTAKDTVKDTTDKVTEPVEDAEDAEDAEDTVDQAEDEAGDPEDKADDAEGAEATDPMAPDANGKKPFPCVVEKKVDGDAEQTPVPIPDDPWELEASSLLLKGLDYKGVVNLTTAGGKKKQALKFTVDNGTDIGDLHQIAPGPDGSKYHIRADEGSTSTIRDGQTIMYTERLQGNLFGLIPIVFDPEHPPPLNVPIAYFTKVKVLQAAQFGGTLKVPGLEQTITR
ncbi:hypothetical protein AB0N81_39740 [Streptomyces sp. NPDC093510]|uniref:hypothetical protein n=1 Tax=Streptomyces sp. NPDC093510 TaxID=3155199 RepID=UPI003436D6DD